MPQLERGKVRIQIKRLSSETPGLARWAGKIPSPFSSTQSGHARTHSHSKSLFKDHSSRALKNGQMCFLSKVGLHFQQLALVMGLLYILQAQQRTCHWTLLLLWSLLANSAIADIKYACWISALFCFISTCQEGNVTMRASTFPEWKIPLWPFSLFSQTPCPLPTLDLPF